MLGREEVWLLMRQDGNRSTLGEPSAAPAAGLEPGRQRGGPGGADAPEEHPLPRRDVGPGDLLQAGTCSPARVSNDLTLEVPVRVALRPLLLLVALSPAAPLARADAAIPGLATTEQRILLADVVLVARCSPLAEPAALGVGGLHALEVREVLQDWRGIGPLDGYRLDDRIPGSSSWGDRTPVPDDVDVLIFARADPSTRTLVLAGCHRNDVVPLRGLVTDCWWDGLVGYVVAEVTPGELLARVREEAARYATFARLEAAYEAATGSRHPHTGSDRPRILARLLALEDPRREPFVRRVEADPGLSPACRELIRAWRAAPEGRSR